jgi:plastocyanin
MPSRDLRILGIAAAVLFMAAPVLAEDVIVVVTDDADAPVKDAIVSLMSPGPAMNAGAGTKDAAVMTQQNKEFAPHVLAVRIGTTVRFPNKDDFRHQIYSFSRPKTFEISLYSGDEDKRETFDKPGVVALGCNIHDNMLGYIYVLATDHYAATGRDGVALVSGVKPGRYALSVWHPRQRGADFSQDVTIVPGVSMDMEVRLSLKPPLPGAGQ